MGGSEMKEFLIEFLNNTGNFKRSEIHVILEAYPNERTVKHILEQIINQRSNTRIDNLYALLPSNQRTVEHELAFTVVLSLDGKIRIEPEK